MSEAKDLRYKWIGRVVAVCIFLVVIQGVIIPSLNTIESDPCFLLWKACNYVWHKLILAEHLRAQRCAMKNYHVDKKEKNRLQISLVQIYHKEAVYDSWHGKSEAICALYARRHGYGYIHVHAVAEEVALQGDNRSHRRNRTMHWARIPILLWLLKNHLTMDWWFYLDMDAMINPRAMHFPVTWIFSAMEHDPTCIIRKSSNPHTLIYFSNADREPHMPCSGTFLASSSSGKDLILWWNYNSSAYFDSHSEFDQHIVHELMYFKPDEFSFMVLDVRQFDLGRSSFILHYSGSRQVSEKRLHHTIIMAIQRSKSISSKDLFDAFQYAKEHQSARCVIDMGSSVLSQQDSAGIDCTIMM